MREGKRIKKSFSITPEAEKFIRRTRKLRRASSDSEALNLLLQDAIAADALRALDESTTKYYDEATDEMLEKERLWGVMSEAALAELREYRVGSYASARRGLVGRDADRSTG